MFEIKSIEWDCKYILLLLRWAWFQLSQGLQCSFGTLPMKGCCHKVGLNIWCLYLALRHLLNLNGPFQCTKLSFTYRKYVNNLLDESMPKSIYLILLVLFTCHLDYCLWVTIIQIPSELELWDATQLGSATAMLKIARYYRVIEAAKWSHMSWSHTAWEQELWPNLSITQTNDSYLHFHCLGKAAHSQGRLIPGHSLFFLPPTG